MVWSVSSSRCSLALRCGCLPVLAADMLLRFSAGCPTQHNVCGRSIYAQGTVDAVLFIAERARERSPKKLFNMVDVLSAGMR